MHDPTDQPIREKLLQETARIAWADLQRYFAAGQTLLVNSSLDLVEVASQLHEDNFGQFKQWVETEQVQSVSDAQAKQWFDEKAELWCVVVKPWVLLQQERPKLH